MGVKMENYSSSSLLFLRNLILTPLFLSADKPLTFIFSHKSTLFHLFRRLLVSVFFLIFHLLHSLTSHLLFSSTIIGKHRDHDLFRHDHDERLVNSTTGRGGDTKAISRAIYQLLSLVTNIPVTSRKYEVVRSLAEKLLDENLKEGSENLRRVNCDVLSEVFGKTILQLETALLGQGCVNGNGIAPGGFGLGRVVKAAKGWCHVKEDGGPAAEKMAAELVWLGQKMEESGGGEVVVEKWGGAKNLGWVALAAEPRVQASLVKLTAFLIKYAKNMGKEQVNKKSKTIKIIKMMLTTWLPLLCEASHGIEAPTLTTIERGEIERAIEEIIDMIEEVESQEQVLSLWLHHFAKCSSSDWPNLHGSYIRWCNVARKLLLTDG